MYRTNKIIRTINLIGAIVLVTFAFSPAVRAVDPPPDGGYPGDNTAEGDNALFSVVTGAGNTAIGASALFGNSTGDANTAIGSGALFSNTDGYQNTASGSIALRENTTGSQNTANGSFTLFFNTTGSANTASGADALYANGTGNNNTANGYLALRNTIGSNNIALGSSAGINLTTGSNNIDVGNAGVAGESGHIRIGTVGTHTRTAIAGISGATVANGVGVLINPQGQLGTITSSARFKDAIQPMDKASEAILALKPVTFRYKKELDPDGILQFGLVAEQVAKVDPDLVARDEHGKPYTVRYEAVNAMLLNEFLKEHRKVETQEATIIHLKSTISQQRKDFTVIIAQRHEELRAIATEQDKKITALTATLKEQASQLQKVGNRVDLGRPALQLVANEQ